MVSRVQNFTADPTDGTNEVEFSWTNPSDATKVYLLSSGSIFPRTVQDNEVVFNEEGDSIKDKDYTLRRTFDDIFNLGFFTVLVGNSTSLNRSIWYKENTDVCPVENNDIAENYNLRGNFSGGKNRIQATHDGDFTKVDNVIILQSPIDYEGSIDSNLDAVRTEDKTKVISNPSETFSTSFNVNGNETFFYKCMSQHIDTGGYNSFIVPGKNILSLSSDNKSNLPSQVTAESNMDSKTRIFIDTESFHKTLQLESSWGNQNPFSNQWTKEITGTTNPLDVTWNDSNSTVKIGYDNPNDGQQNKGSFYEAGGFTEDLSTTKLNKINYQYNFEFDGAKPPSSTDTAVSEYYINIGQMTNYNNDPNSGYQTKVRLESYLDGSGNDVNEGTLIFYQFDNGSREKLLENNFTFNSDENINFSVSFSRDTTEINLNVSGDINIDTTLNNISLIEENVETDSSFYAKINENASKTYYYLNSLFIEGQVTSTDKIEVRKTKGLESDPPSNIDDGSLVDRFKYNGSNRMVLEDSNVSNLKYYNYSVFTLPNLNSVPVSDQKTASNSVTGIRIGTQNDKFSDDPYNINSKRFKNEDTITLTVKLQKQVEKVTVDFTDIDSKANPDKQMEYTGTNENDEFKFYTEYKISEDNANSDGNNKKVTVIAEDVSSTKTLTIDDITLDNTKPNKPTDVSYSGSGTTSSTLDLAFDWSAGSDNLTQQTNLEYEVKVENGQGTVVNKSKAIDTNFSYQGKEQNEYRLGVRTIDNVGNKSDWSDWSNYIEITGSLVIKNIEEYIEPSNLYGNGEDIWLIFETNVKLNESNSTIDFSNIDNGTSDPVKNPSYVGENEEFYKYEVRHVIDSSNTIADGTYDILFDLEDQNGGTGTATFEAILDNQPPSSTTITDNGDQIGVSPLFSWDDAVDDNTATSNLDYEIQILDGDNNNVYFRNIGNLTSFRYTFDEPMTEYKARVRAVDLSGNRADWSSFTDGVVRDVPEMIKDLQLFPSINEIEIAWTNPPSNLSEVLLIRRTDRLPYNHTDTGTEVHRITSPNPGERVEITDSGLDNDKEYFYGVFGKSPAGFWNDDTPFTGDFVK